MTDSAVTRGMSKYVKTEHLGNSYTKAQAIDPVTSATNSHRECSVKHEISLRLLKGWVQRHS